MTRRKCQAQPLSGSQNFQTTVTQISVQGPVTLLAPALCCAWKGGAKTLTLDAAHTAPVPILPLVHSPLKIACSAHHCECT